MIIQFNLQTEKQLADFRKLMQEIKAGNVKKKQRASELLRISKLHDKSNFWEKSAL